MLEFFFLQIAVDNVACRWKTFKRKFRGKNFNKTCLDLFFIIRRRFCSLLVTLWLGHVTLLLSLGCTSASSSVATASASGFLRGRPRPRLTEASPPGPGFFTAPPCKRMGGFVRPQL